jgi:hypothetical protein
MKPHKKAYRASALLAILTMALASLATGENLPCMQESPQQPASPGQPGRGISTILAVSAGFLLNAGGAQVEKLLLPEWERDRNFGDAGIVTIAVDPDEHFLMSAIITDSSEVYIAGTGVSQTESFAFWHIEKRSVVTGLPVARFGDGGVVRSNPSTEPVPIKALADDNEFLYAAGTDEFHHWRIEKRDIKTGEVSRRFGVAGVVTSRAGEPLAIASDGITLLIAGTDANDGTFIVERRVAADGELETQWADDFVFDPQDVGLKVSAAGNFLYLQTPQYVGLGTTRVVAKPGKTSSFALGFASTTPAVADVALQLRARRAAKHGPLNTHSLPTCGVTALDLQESSEAGL